MCVPVSLSTTIHKAKIPVIQSYMGDRPHKGEHITLVQQLLDITIKQEPKKETRDEVYCQVVKQLTLNPSS
jgi:hypothetical protein